MSWLYRYRLNASYEKVTLGRYPDLTLKAARAKRDDLAAQVADGKSPAQEIKKAKAGSASDPTVQEFGERYFQEQVVRNWKKPAHIRRYLDNEIYPALGGKPLKEITALDVQAIVYRKRDHGRIAAAMQLRGVMKQMFDYAIEVQQATMNPAAMVATRYIGKARKRSRVLTPQEIRLYLHTIYQSNIRRQFKLALHILLLTLSRKSELSASRRSCTTSLTPNSSKSIFPLRPPAVRNVSRSSFRNGFVTGTISDKLSATRPAGRETRAVSRP